MSPFVVWWKTKNKNKQEKWIDRHEKRVSGRAGEGESVREAKYMWTHHCLCWQQMKCWCCRYFSFWARWLRNRSPNKQTGEVSHCVFCSSMSCPCPIAAPSLFLSRWVSTFHELNRICVRAFWLNISRSSEKMLFLSGRVCASKWN